VSFVFRSVGHRQRVPVKAPDGPSTLPVMDKLAVEGVIQNPDSSPAEAGLQVTIIVGEHSPETVSSTSRGSYSLIFRGSVVAKLGDTMEVRVSRGIGDSAARTVKLKRKEIRDKRVTIDVRFPAVKQPAIIRENRTKPRHQQTGQGLRKNYTKGE